jgi:hypothetical protein
VRTDILRSRLAVGLAFHLAVAPGFATTAVPAIGTLVTGGAFRLNHATVRSNATVFEGAMIETGTASARIALASGTRLELEPESTGLVFGGHLVLERGSTQIGRTAGSAVASTTGFLVEARGLTIQSGTTGSTGRIVLIGAGRVEVAARTGSFRVLNSGGMLVAKIAAGRALALEPKLTPGPVRITGRLMVRDGHYLLTDETTNVTVEVSGSALIEPGLTKALGRRVEVTGSARPGANPAGGGTQLIDVAQVTPAPASSGGAPAGSAPAGSGGAGGTAPAGAGGAGGAASSSAVSVPMIAIIGGVAAAAVVGGLAASGSLGGSSASPVSR